jgi:hypothetical protein
MNRPETLLDDAERVLATLGGFQIDAIVIGAVALAAHHYVRFTEDLDLAMNADRQTFRDIAEALRESGFQVELRLPDLDDPLSGVIDAESARGMIQLVNFGQTFPVIIDAAIKQASLTVREGSPLRVAPLPYLVALKLYAGGLKSKADVVEVLKRNAHADLDEICALCEKYRLPDLRGILNEAGEVT